MKSHRKGVASASRGAAGAPPPAATGDQGGVAAPAVAAATVTAVAAASITSDLANRKRKLSPKVAKPPQVISFLTPIILSFLKPLVLVHSIETIKLNDEIEK